MAEPQLRRMSQDEFLAWQEKQDKLYELVDGLPVLPVKMMTGASRAHDRVVVNTIASLHRQLRGGPCQPTTDDLAVRVPSGNVRRPDVTVECGRGDRRDTAVREPRLVVEVLSPSTMSFDRIRKIPEYQGVPTISHILLVDTEAPRIDCWSREGDGRWSQTKLDGLAARIDLPTIGATLTLEEVFEGLDFPG
ncbi:MAG: Uma2 family endonuclease [Variibacter sp.]|nr:Uma2 family endonuclease [Variibacter sp.]